MGKQKRIFKPEFKLKICQEVDAGIKTRADAIREYDLVESVLAKWIKAFRNRGPEAFNNNFNENAILKKRIAELEKALGRKTLETEILQETLKLANLKKGGYTSL